MKADRLALQRAGRKRLSETQADCFHGHNRASTSQIRDLYDRSSTFLFPPPGLDAGDSFFATYDRDEKGKLRPGRMYVVC